MVDSILNRFHSKETQWLYPPGPSRTGYVDSQTQENFFIKALKTWNYKSPYTDRQQAGGNLKENSKL